jgi:hypothetical protein
MITKRMAAALVAGSLAIGLAAGTVGTIIAKDATPSQTAVAACIDHMDDMGGMMNGAGGMMNGAGGMMNGTGGMMNGTGGMMNGAGGMTGPGASAMPSAMPDYMQQHHAAPSQAPVQ